MWFSTTHRPQILRCSLMSNRKLLIFCRWLVQPLYGPAADAGCHGGRLAKPFGQGNPFPEKCVVYTATPKNKTTRPGKVLSLTERPFQPHHFWEAQYYVFLFCWGGGVTRNKLIPMNQSFSSYKFLSVLNPIFLVETSPTKKNSTF